LAIFVFESVIIIVELLHRMEVGAANANNDDGARLNWQFYKLPLSFRHIADLTVSKYEQDVVDGLISLALLERGVTQ